jgi:hypothetical protein
MSITQFTIISPPSITPETESKVKEDLIRLNRDKNIKFSTRMSDKDSIIESPDKLSDDDTFTITIGG